MSQKERENFYRNSTAIVDNGNEALGLLIDNELSQNGLSFSDFINRNIHDIYHLYENKQLCCQCIHGVLPPSTPRNRVLHLDQLNLLMDKHGHKLWIHNPRSTSPFCCCQALPTTTLCEIDITLKRCLLVNFASNCQPGSPVRQAVENLVEYRNKLYGHAKVATMTDNDFQKNFSDIEREILVIAKFCNVENEMKQKLRDTKIRPLDEAICRQYQIQLLSETLKNSEIKKKVSNLKKAIEKIDNHLGDINEKTKATLSVLSEMQEGQTISEEYAEVLYTRVRESEDHIRTDVEASKRHILEKIDCLEHQISYKHKDLHDGLDKVESSINANIREARNTISKEVSDLRQDEVQRENRLHTHLDEAITNIRQNPVKDQRKQNIVAQTQHRIKQHNENGNYVETKAVQKSQNLLDKTGILVLVSRGGAGKTTTCLQLASMYQDNGYLPLFFIDQEIKQYRDVINPYEKCIVIVDDLFGRTNVQFDENIHRNLLDILLNLVKENTGMKLVFTIRQDRTLSQKIFEKHRMFKDEIVLDLDNKCQLSYQEKRDILSRYMETFNVRSCSCQADLCIGALHDIQNPYFCEDKFVVYPDKSAQICKSAFFEIIESEPYTGFPEACRLFCSERAFTVLGIKYFNSTTQSLVEKINDIFIQGVENNQMFSMYQYCILVYIALKGHIKSESVKNNFEGNAFFRNLFETIFEVENVKLKKTCTERALAVMEETMLEKILRTNPKTNKNIVVNNKQYDWEFKHETICEAVQMSFGMKCPKLLLDFCDLDFIVENVLPSTNEYDTSDQPLKICIPQDLLIERMKNILSKGREVINRLYPDSDEYCGFDSSSEHKIGVYIRNIAKNNNNDLFLKRFFELIPVNTLQNYQIRDLFDGLTNKGKDKMVICYNPGKFDRYIWKYCKRDVILALCRPTTSNLNSGEFIFVGDKGLLIRLFKFIDSIDIDHEHEITKISEFLLMVGMGEGNHGFVKSFLTSLAAKIKEGNTRSSMVRIFIDGLTDEGKREEILPCYFDFFTHHLLQHGSLIVLLRLCTFRGEPNDEDMTCIVTERRPFIEYASERFYCCLGGYQLKENYSHEKQMEAIGRELYSFVMRIRNKTIIFDLLQSFVDSYNSAFVITKEECQLSPLIPALKSKKYAELISFYDGFTDFGKHLDELTGIYPLFIKTFEKATKLYKPLLAFTTRLVNLLVEKDDTSNVKSN